MAYAQNAQDVITKVVWGEGTGYIVTTTSRSYHSHSGHLFGAPPIVLTGITDWDLYYNEFDLNWEGIRFTFPGNQSPPPKISDLRPKLPNGQDNPNRVLRWGGFDQPDVAGGGGTVGATRTKKNPPVLNGPQRFPSSAGDGYTDGQIIHDMMVLNVTPIKAITGKDDFTFNLYFPMVEELPDSGGSPTARTVYFPWGAGSTLENDIQPFVFPVFPGAAAPAVFPNWDGIHPNYKYKGLSNVANAAVVLTWMLNNVNTGIPGVPYPPWDIPILPTGGADGGQAVMQAMVDWANGVFEGFSGVDTFVLASGVAHYAANPAIVQPEVNYRVTVGYYKKPPILIPPNAQPSSPVPFFPVDAQNNPLWDLTKADQTIVKEFGGSAPQPNREMQVKLSKGSDGKPKLTADLVIQTFGP